MNTLEMLNEIKVGQIARCLDREEMMYGVLKYNDLGIYWVKTKESTPKADDELQLTGMVMDEYKWQLQPMPPKGITLQEAFEIIKGGGMATCYNEGDCCVYDSIHDVIDFNDLINGKWYLGNVEEIDIPAEDQDDELCGWGDE